MTINAAGILFLTKDKKALFLQRGPGGDMPGHFCFPGGSAEDDETAEQTAIRETVEEIGFLPDGDRGQLTQVVSEIAADANAPRHEAVAINPGAASSAPSVDVAPGPTRTVNFVTFVQSVDREFEPRLNEEHVGWAWAPVDQPPLPLHPGCQIALDRVSMDELGVAVAMRDGRLPSPQRYHNMTLFDIRITGTGMSFRPALNEVVYRRPENYLTPEFLARCNGLAVIWQHPQERATLNTDEFKGRVIGAVMLPYIKGDEVWAIAKIHNDDAAAWMASNPMSTSPAVVLPNDSNINIELEDGKTMLIEGKPKLLDHIAVLTGPGVWDKGGPLAGVVASEARSDSVSALVKVRPRPHLDGALLNKVARSVNTLEGRMDALAKRRSLAL